MNPDEIQRGLDYFVLSTLARDPMRCSELELGVDKKTRGVFQKRILFSEALERMESAGWVHGERRQEDANLEKVYSLTAAGKDQLEAEQKRKQAVLARVVEEGHWPSYRLNEARPGSSN